MKAVHALVVKGLSRLPVTEEIAGSIPVERAKKKYYPSGWYFFLLCLVPESNRRSDEQSESRSPGREAQKGSGSLLTSLSERRSEVKRSDIPVLSAHIKSRFVSERRSQLAGDIPVEHKTVYYLSKAHKELGPTFRSTLLSLFDLSLPIW